MYGRDSETGKWKVFRVMIDKEYQAKGYGKAAMLLIIEQISTKPDVEEILIAYQTTNEVARKLYAELGFIEQNVDEFGKVTASLALPFTP